MKNHCPIYNLLHQEIRTCADHLLEMSQEKEFSLEKNTKQVLERMLELHGFASRVRTDAYYKPLCDLKKYLENTMLRYQDEQHRLQTMRLSEAIALIGIPSPTDMKFKPSILRSLIHFFVRHFLEDTKPGRPLYRKLTEIKKI